MTTVDPDAAIYTQVAAVVDQFAPISLEEMDAVALLNRVDLKFILTPEQLLHVLEQLGDAYRVLSVGHIRLSRYHTLYFDTPGFALYQQHHNGGQNRYKVRFRSYIDSGLTFLEVKFKNNKGRTLKNRCRVATASAEIDQKMQLFLQAALPFDARSLEPKLWNRFIRITLVSEQHIERLTLDLDLSFGNDDSATRFSCLAIAEVKQTGVGRQSVFVRQMRTLRAHPLSFSKYCISAALQYPHLKQNNFKSAFLHMRKLGAMAVSGTI